MDAMTNLWDHMAYTHECGSVRFHLLRSGAIECADCNQRLHAMSHRPNEDECPKCGGVEWDHITSERGMHPSDLPINRCGCGHEWDPDSREGRMVVIERNQSGTPAVWCDPEIADIVAALNAAGLRTVASCSGHGEKPGSIVLADGRELRLAADSRATPT